MRIKICGLWRAKVKHPISWNAVLAVMPDPYPAHLRLYRRRSNY